MDPTKPIKLTVVRYGTGIGTLCKGHTPWSNAATDRPVYPVTCDGSCCHGKSVEARTFPLDVFLKEHCGAAAAAAALGGADLLDSIVVDGDISLLQWLYTESSCSRILLSPDSLLLIKTTPTQNEAYLFKQVVVDDSGRILFHVVLKTSNKREEKLILSAEDYVVLTPQHCSKHLRTPEHALDASAPPATAALVAAGPSCGAMLRPSSPNVLEKNIFTTITVNCVTQQQNQAGGGGDDGNEDNDDDHRQLDSNGDGDYEEGEVRPSLDLADAHPDIEANGVPLVPVPSGVLHVPTEFDICPYQAPAGFTPPEPAFLSPVADSPIPRSTVAPPGAAAMYQPQEPQLPGNAAAPSAGNNRGVNNGTTYHAARDPRVNHGDVPARPRISGNKRPLDDQQQQQQQQHISATVQAERPPVSVLNNRDAPGTAVGRSNPANGAGAGAVNEGLAMEGARDNPAKKSRIEAPEGRIEVHSRSRSRQAGPSAARSSGQQRRQSSPRRSRSRERNTNDRRADRYSNRGNNDGRDSDDYLRLKDERDDAERDAKRYRSERNDAERDAKRYRSERDVANSLAERYRSERDVANGLAESYRNERNDFKNGNEVLRQNNDELKVLLERAEQKLEASDAARTLADERAANAEAQQHQLQQQVDAFKQNEQKVDSDLDAFKRQHAIVKKQLKQVQENNTELAKRVKETGTQQSNMKDAMEKRNAELEEKISQTEKALKEAQAELAKAKAKAEAKARTALQQQASSSAAQVAPLQATIDSQQDQIEQLQAQIAQLEELVQELLEAQTNILQNKPPRRDGEGGSGACT